ncbi:2-phospho-L-lactate transferase CofD family protein [Micromonospora sp. M12]
MRYRAEIPTHRFVFVGAEAAKPAPGVLDAIASADLVLIAPSNPVVSVAPVLAVPGMREAVAGGPAPVVGFHRSSAAPGPRDGRQVPGRARRRVQRGRVGRLYGGRANGGLLDGWLVAEEDAGTVVPG